MGDVIFCKTRYQDHGYHSYRDFWSLVDLASYPIIYVDEIDPASDNTYIVTPLNGEWMHGWRQPRARIIHWELEWRTDWRAEANEPPGIAEVWASDYAYAMQIGAKYVCVGSDPLLNLDPDSQTTKVYDVAMLQYMTHRRHIIRQQLIAAGVSIAPDGWDWQRHESLSKSRMMLHVHQHDHVQTIAPLRWAIAAAYRLPVFTESVLDISMLGTHDVPYEMLTREVVQWLRNGGRTLVDMGERLYQDLCVENTFWKCVEGAL